jgi:hypothetical protein
MIGWRRIKEVAAMDNEQAKHDLKEIEAVLSTGGNVGNMPDWYIRLRYAQYLCIPPWEVESAILEHGEWFERAGVAMQAERKAKERARSRRSQLTIRDEERPDMEGVPIPRVDAVSRRSAGE